MATRGGAPLVARTARPCARIAVMSDIGWHRICTFLTPREHLDVGVVCVALIRCASAFVKTATLRGDSVLFATGEGDGSDGELFVGAQRLADAHARFPALRSVAIDLSDGDVARIPIAEIDALFSFSDTVTRLVLCGNEIATLPPSICGLRRLATLDLATNDIVALPDSFGALTSLRELFAAGVAA